MCQTSGARSLGQTNGFDIRSCGCGTLFTAELPAATDEKDYEAFYAGGRSVPIPDFVLGRLGEIVASFERYRSLNRWLDLGCGAGTLLQAAVDGGWQAIGTEVAPAAVQAARAAGLDVRLGETGDLDLRSAGFDVVSMVEVIEHVHDPHALLGEAARMVRPGGALYLTTPHGRGISARLLRTRWSVVTPPDHLQLLSIHGLRAALDDAGLVVRSVSTHGLNPYELVAGLRHGRARTQTHSNTETSYRLNESLSTRRSGVIVKRAVNGALTAVRLGDTLKVVAERPAS